MVFSLPTMVSIPLVSSLWVFQYVQYIHVQKMYICACVQTCEEGLSEEESRYPEHGRRTHLKPILYANTVTMNVELFD